MALKSEYIELKCLTEVLVLLFNSLCLVYNMAKFQEASYVTSCALPQNRHVVGLRNLALYSEKITEFLH